MMLLISQDRMVKYSGIGMQLPIKQNNINNVFLVVIIITDNQPHLGDLPSERN